MQTQDQSLDAAVDKAWDRFEAELRRRQHAEIERLKAQRNALRAALKQAVARQGFTNDELISARALIANATGENK